MQLDVGIGKLITKSLSISDCLLQLLVHVRRILVLSSLGIFLLICQARLQDNHLVLQSLGLFPERLLLATGDAKLLTNV